MIDYEKLDDEVFMALKEDEVKDVKLNIRVSNKEREQFKAIAQIRGFRTLSEYFRTLIREDYIEWRDENGI